MSVSTGCPSELHQRERSERIGPGDVDRNINLLWNGTKRLQFSRLWPLRTRSLWCGLEGRPFINDGQQCRHTHKQTCHTQTAGLALRPSRPA
ncbi:hypothetical protein QQF64_004198 [Cirrhinus molitorella]|uniref:Uncharacterized protein n=1 Tax=Cirrhinus molitorella TaxID=172907 RepID=A0ABR3MFI4_9TELE